MRRDANGRLIVPERAIEDWPKLQLRFLHWDTKHHQDRIETLKRYLDWSARFKANMIGFELEDKFEYPSPVISAGRRTRPRGVTTGWKAHPGVPNVQAGAPGVCTGMRSSASGGRQQLPVGLLRPAAQAIFSM
jgi:hypothetical protein